mmetsp:Transcript_3579/g.6494  ORF Transcript_3579/g.6494 Transcript_3579/m.6494 type:complete len:499 (+) Transcript_3579:537-2033(+)
MDHVVGLLDGFTVRRGDLDDALVVDVDLGARDFHDLADDLAARADHFTDLVGRDLHGLDARRVLREFTRFGHGFCHLAEDVETTGFRLLQRLFHDLLRDAGDLDVHLQGRDARFGTGNLEVHVAEVIFITQDVGQDAVGAVLFQHETHGDTGNRCLQGNARVHHGEGATAHGRHGGRAVGFSDLRHHAHGVGEIGRGGQNRLQGAPCQLAVTDLATTRRAHATRFTDRVGREVVVQQEVGFEVAVQRVDELLVVAGAERRDAERLSLATGEQRGAVGPGQDLGLGHDVTDLVQGATVDTAAVLDDIRAKHGGFQLLQGGGEVRILQLLFRQAFLHAFLDGGNGCLTLQLVADRIGFTHLVFAGGADGFEQLRVIGGLEVERLFRGVFGQIDDQVDDRLDRVMGEFHRAEHFRFGQLIGLGLHHHDGVLGAGHNQIKALIGVVAEIVHVVDLGVQDVFAILEAHAATGDRAAERRAGDRQGSRGCDHRDHVGVVDEVVG